MEEQTFLAFPLFVMADSDSRASTGESRDAESSAVETSSNNDNNVEDEGGESSSAWESSSRGEASSSMQNESTDADADAGTESEADSDRRKKKKKNKSKKKVSMVDSSAEESAADESSVDVGTSQAESCNDTGGDATTIGDESSEPSAAGKTSSSSRQGLAADENWTVSEDALLRGMKEAGDISWADIAAALCRRKKEVQARWKVIRGRKGEGETTEEEEQGKGETTTEGETEAETGGETGEETTEAETTEAETNDDAATTDVETTDVSSPTGKAKAEANTNKQPTSSQDDDDNEDEPQDVDTPPSTTTKQKKKQKQSPPKTKTSPTPKSQKDKSSIVTNKWHKGATRNPKVSAENKTAKAKAKAKLKAAAYQQASPSSSSDNHDASPEPSSSSSSNADHDPDPHHQDTRYILDHVYPALYPPTIHPSVPDSCGGLSSQDCRLLAILDSRQKRNRWLEMQADFFNATGRMVPLDVIRDRCERAEAEAGEEARRGTVERWMDHVEYGQRE